MRILIVYETIPEDTNFYAIESVGEELEKIKAAHGRFGNLEDENEDKAVWLYHFLEDNKKKMIRSEAGKPIEGNFDLIVHSGFAL